MRVKSKNWSATCGVKAGHYHLYKGVNCQDAAAIVAGPDMVVGVGCDGCGEGNHSELGAIATANFALREVLRLRRSGYGLTQIVEQLFSAIVRFIDMNIFLTCPVETPAEVADFIKHHWLATIMGFIVLDDSGVDLNDGNRGIVFWCGDGVFATRHKSQSYHLRDVPGVPPDRDNVIPIDQNNAPTYIAYNCVRSPSKVGVQPDNIPRSFSCWEFGGGITKVMVASDGFDHHNPDKLQAAREKESELPDSLHGQQWDKKGQFGLKKWMNSRSDRGYFEDDCFVITAEKTCEPQ